jgi:chromate transporter
VYANGLRLYIPDVTTLDVASLVIAVAAFVALFRFKLGMIPTLFLSALVGLVYHMMLRG